MLILYYLTAALVAAVLVGVGILLHFKASKKLNIFFKSLSLILATVFFVRYMTGRDAILSISNLKVSDATFSAKGWIVLALFQVWFANAAELLIILAPFFKLKSMPALVSFFASFTFLINFAFLFNHVTAITGNAALSAFDYRALLMSVEAGIGLGFCVVYTVVNARKILLHKTEWLWFALGILGLVLASLPSFTFNVLLDPLKFSTNPKNLNLYHRLLLYPAFVIPVVLYLLLKDKSDETRRFSMMYYAWAGLINFMLFYKFADFISKDWVTNLPLHLCNTAMFITPLCLTFKWKKLFYFTYFINVLGALFALLMPNYNSTHPFISPFVWRFYLNHYQAFFMPLLIVGLGIFRRPRWKEFQYSMVGFAVYFVLMIVFNAWFTNYNPDVDYFFLNSDFIAEKLGTWAEKTRNVVWQFDIGDLNFTFYPVYQFLFLLVYVGLAFAVWFVYELAFGVITGWQDIAARNKKIKVDNLALQVKLAGRSIEEPMSMENANKLVLKKFTKRYGASDVYAVKDADLEVVGGEIFGFLGPNGAGKSTIIKSIVGIQTITDGSIEVCGYDVKTQPVQAKKQIGFVPDHYALYERLTAREYINYIADLYGVSQEDRDERLNRFIELFEFQSAIDNPIKTYSHGMKQKVTIMSALIHNPKVWILDEPLTGLDPNSIYQVKECMKRHAKEGNVVFFSSHIIDVVERICDKIAIIRKGQIQCVKDVHQMETNGESLEEFYMQTINGSEVNPIAVDGVTASGVEEKPAKTKRGLFGKLGKSNRAEPASESDKSDTQTEQPINNPEQSEKQDQTQGSDK
ncbi:MAG: YwaF family protein [Corallococcus sp.]|nr:YwaF family protein [Corallococcus sp.]MCM1359916.1 YwaF family protein [Corallococcus sp.]MCM1395349.1 YwaF family protein [Corallococcus sp.]